MVVWGQTIYKSFLPNSVLRSRNVHNHLCLLVLLAFCPYTIAYCIYNDLFKTEFVSLYIENCFIRDKCLKIKTCSKLVSEFANATAPNLRIGHKSTASNVHIQMQNCILSPPPPILHLHLAESYDPMMQQCIA